MLSRPVVSILQTPWVVGTVCVNVSVSKGIVVGKGSLLPAMPSHPRGWVWEGRPPTLGWIGLGRAQPLLSTSVQAGAGGELRARSGRHLHTQVFWDDSMGGAAATRVQAWGRRLQLCPLSRGKAWASFSTAPTGSHHSPTVLHWQVCHMPWPHAHSEPVRSVLAAPG